VRQKVAHSPHRGFTVLSQLVIGNSQTDEAIGFLELRLAGEADRRRIAEDVEQLLLLGPAGLEELESFHDLDAARAAGGAATGERNRGERLVANIDEGAALGDLDRALFAEEV